MSTPRGRGNLVAGSALTLLVAAWTAADDVPPRFEGGVEVIAVDANVVDGKGQPVGDLTPDEFVVKVDGQTRQVLSAEFVDLGSGGGPAPVPAAGSASALPPVAAARRSEGRRIVIVVDRGQLGGSVHLTAQAASRLLEGMGPEDRVAVFSLPSGPRLDFTADRAAALAVLGKIGPIQDRFMGEFNISYSEALGFLGGRSRSNGVVYRECEQALRQGGDRPLAAAACEQRVEQEARRQVDEHERSVEDRLSALEALCQALVRVPGPKALVLVSGGFTAALSGGRVSVTEQLRRIATAAAASRVSLYSIYFSHPVDAFDASRSREQFTPEEDRRIRSAGLGELTGMAGGALFEVVAGANFAFDRVASETRAGYLLGLEPGKHDRDGKPHAIEVKVLRKEVEVRARRQFVMADPPPTVARVRPASPASPPSPLRVATHVLRGDFPEQIKVVMAAQADGFAGARFGIEVRDPRGAVIGRLDENEVAAEGGAVRHQETLILPRGVYTLKAQVVDAGGQTVVLERPLNAELGHAVGFDVSDLFLLESLGKTKRLSATGWIASDTMGLYLEIYVQDQLPTQGIGVTVEILDAGGRRRSSIALPVKEDTGKALLYAEGVVDLWALPPGAYVARALVTSARKVARTIDRPFQRKGGS